MLSRSQRGDTMIEVLLAFSIFAVVVVATFAIMNRGVNAAQQSLEVILVRQQIDSQAELLRYVRETQPIVWKTIVNPANVATNGSDACSDPTSANKAFFVGLDATGKPTRNAINSGNYSAPSTYSMINYTSGSSKAYGTWVQAVQAAGNGAPGSPKAYDMHIHACWQGTTSGPNMTLSTIVRLYE
jgi:type II secretory pathway pseudopilin PulG